MTAPAASSPGGASTHYERRMRELELTVRELLAAVQQERKAKLDKSTRTSHTVLKVGDQVLLPVLTKELLDAADIGKLLPRWDGPIICHSLPEPQRLHAPAPAALDKVTRHYAALAGKGLPAAAGAGAEEGRRGACRAALAAHVAAAAKKRGGARTAEGSD